ncbi:hypothetical protein GQ55_2G434900 [Panicum hallii var. hallii]|nr:hypothetical protein GQ55_2G434900 [Panicum hallii var. hallii]
MLYLQLLEETFVSQLHDSERSFKGLFNLSPRYCGRVKSAKQIVEYAKPDQGCCGIVDADKVNTSMKVELMDSPSCGNQQDGKVHSMDDNASTTEPVEEAISQARATNSEQCSTCYVGKHRHSPSRSADFYKRTTRAFTQRGRIRTLMRRPKGLENQEEDAAKSD